MFNLYFDPRYGLTRVFVEPISANPVLFGDVTLMLLLKSREFLRFACIIASMISDGSFQFLSKQHARRIDFFFILIAVFLMPILVTGSPAAAENPTTAVWPVEFRGYVSYKGGPSFSLRDLETGHAWWMRTGQERFGFRIEGFNAEDETLIVSRDGRSQEIRMRESEDAILMVRSSMSSLSPINRKVYQLSERLVRATRSEATGRLVRDDRDVQKLRDHLLTNPSVSELHAFLPELGDAIDYEEFLKIDFPDVLHNRNEQNTPRWGIDKSLDLKDIEQLIASNLTKAELDSALQEK